MVVIYYAIQGIMCIDPKGGHYQMQQINHGSQHIGKGSILILLLLVYSAVPVWTASAQPHSLPPYTEQLMHGTLGASLGFLGGATLGGCRHDHRAWWPAG